MLNNICGKCPKTGGPIFIYAGSEEENIITGAIEYFAGDSNFFVYNISGMSVEELDTIIEKLTKANQDKRCIFLSTYNHDTLAYVKKYDEVYSWCEKEYSWLDSVVKKDHAQCAVNGLAENILTSFGYTSTPKFSEEKAAAINEMVRLNYTGMLNRDIGFNSYDIGIDEDGHIIARTHSAIDVSTKEKRIEAANILGISLHDLEHAAYAGLDFITLSKEDAALADSCIGEAVHAHGLYFDWFENFNHPIRKCGRHISDRLDGSFYGVYVKNRKPETDEQPVVTATPEAIKDDNWRTPGYHKSNEEKLILEPTREDGEWSDEEWAVLCKLCNLPANTTKRIVINANNIECFVGDGEE